MSYTISDLEALYADFLRAGTHLSFFDYLRYLEAPKGKLMADCENAEKIPVYDFSTGGTKVSYHCNATTCTCIDNPKNIV